MPQQKTFRFQAMTGGMNTTSEDDSLVMFKAGQEARDIENFVPLIRGGQQKTTGFTEIVDAGANPITGIYRFLRSTGEDYFVVTSGTTLYTLSGSTLTSRYTSLENNAYIDFETALDYLVFCDGVNVPRKWDGTTFSDVAGGPPSGARQSVWYQNRLFVFSTSTDPGYLFYSDANNLDAGYGTQFINCDNEDGQKITAIAKLFLPGQEFSSVLLVGKERSVGIVTGDGTTGNPYAFQKINEDTGIPSFRGILQYEQNLVYMSPRGVSSYKTDLNYTNLTFAYLSEKVRDQFTSLNQSTLNINHCWFDWKNSRASFACCESGFSTPNVIWHYDIRLSAWYKERWPSGYTCTACFIDSDGTWYHGDSAGRLFEHDTSNSFNGLPINAYYTTPYVDFGSPQVRKRFLEGRATIEGNGAYNMGIAWSFDHGVQAGKQNTIPLAAVAYQWGGGVWTSNPNVYQWGKAPVSNRRYFPTGHFYSAQMTFSNSGANEPLNVFDLSFVVEYQEWR